MPKNGRTNRSPPASFMCPPRSTRTVPARRAKVGRPSRSRTASVSRATAANKGGQGTLELIVTVVADPAELAAVEQGLAVAGGVMLVDVMDVIGERFVNAGASEGGSNAPPPAPSAFGDRSAPNVFAAEWGASVGSFAAGEASEAWPPVRPVVGVSSASRSLASEATPRSRMGSWSLWGRGSGRSGAHRCRVRVRALGGGLRRARWRRR